MSDIIDFEKYIKGLSKREEITSSPDNDVEPELGINQYVDDTGWYENRLQRVRYLKGILNLADTILFTENNMARDVDIKHLINYLDGSDVINTRFVDDENGVPIVLRILAGENYYDVTFID